MEWSEKEVARLNELRLDPLKTGAAIAEIMNKEFGTDRSRVSVIAKINRMGYSTGSGPVVRKSKTSMPMKKRASPTGFFSRQTRAVKATAPPKNPTAAPIAAWKFKPLDKETSAKKTEVLLEALKKIETIQLALDTVGVKSTADLKPNHCRWPIGDPKHKDFGYCGHPRLAGHPYCEPHAIRASPDGNLSRLKMRDQSGLMESGDPVVEALVGERV